MIKLWHHAAAMCLFFSAVLTLISGSAVLRAVFLVEVLVVLSLVYVDSCGGLKAARLFDLPVLLTARIAFSFGIVPLHALLVPARMDVRLIDNVDLVVEALLLVIVGMLSFWAGSKTIYRRSSVRTRLETGLASGRSAILCAVGTYALGFACKLYLLQHRLFAFTRSREAYVNNIAEAQWYMFGDSFATLGLLLICIEHFSNRSNRLVRWMYWAIVMSECGWGFVSGMKQFLLIDFLAIAAIATVSSGKLARRWVLSSVAGLVLLYPFFNIYRSVVQGKGSIPVDSLSGALSALRQTTAVFQEKVAEGDWLADGTTLTATRLDLLQYFGLTLYLPNRAAELQGEERIWMIPIYPLIPRTVWPSKPVLDKGSRFNRALGGNGQSSTAVPYLVDSYIYGGVLGVIVGMFILGMVIQWFANGVIGVFTKKQIFRYSVAFLFCFKIEDGIVDWWGLLIKTMLVVFVLEWMAYGSIAKRKPNVRTWGSARSQYLPPAGGRGFIRGSLI